MLHITTCSLFQSAYNGKGDRADPSTWPEVEGPLSVSGIFRIDHVFTFGWYKSMAVLPFRNLIM